jgi:3'-phosphoadenosine 5'-phosphosulfate sulfotransferase (PAPS reductase)/FAD synthetase
MPSWVKDEEKWAKAKEIAEREYDIGEDNPDFYRIVTGIYKKMMGGNLAKAVPVLFLKSEPGLMVIGEHTALLLKTHVKGYVRSDGVAVRPHEDKRPGPVTPSKKHLEYQQRQRDLFEDYEPVYSASAEDFTTKIPEGPDLASYDKILIGFSGGKDSIACILALLENGVPKEKIELHHHDIDGDGTTFMDWPITKDYCRKVAGALGMPIYFSWREGGFEREMLRENQRTAPVVFEKPDGTVGRAGGEHGPLGTRRKFPQQSASLTTRWCSGSLKVDVMAAAVRNQDRFTGKRTLVVTGERAEESANRANYKTFESDRSHSNSRHVDHYRPVHGWSEKEVWDIMKKHGIVPHPAYQLGYGRLSCRHCIFAGPNQIATNNALYPESTGQIAAREREFGVTIHRKEDLLSRAKKGAPYRAATDQPEVAKLGGSTEWAGPIVVSPEQWKLPAGAFGEKDGPC